MTASTPTTTGEQTSEQANEQTGEQTSEHATQASSAPATQTLTFTDFDVRADIVEALTRVGITTPFPIQAMTLPVALSGHTMREPLSSTSGIRSAFSAKRAASSG